MQEICVARINQRKEVSGMVHYVDRVLFTLFSCAVAGILMKFLYSAWLSNLYLENISAITQGMVLLDWI